MDIEADFISRERNANKVEKLEWRWLSNFCDRWYKD